MDGGAVALKSSQAAEGGDTQSQTHQRDHHPHPRDDEQDQTLNTAGILTQREQQSVND